MRTLPCLLLLAVAVLGAEAPLTPPQTPPIVYPQPVAKCFLLRIDNRRYELDNQFKDAVALLLGSANYAQTKALFDALKRTIAERAPIEGAVTRAQTALNLATAKVEKSRVNLDGLKQLRNTYRSSDRIDLQELLRMDAAITNETLNLARYEDLEEKAQLKLAEAQKAVLPYNEKVQLAQDKYVAALKDYERTLGAIRAIAIANGKAL
jgi:hypothetical protein